MKNTFSQYFNFSGILKVTKIIINRQLVRPSLKVNSVLDIDVKELRNRHNIKYVIFDKDNTLNLPHKMIFTKKIIEKINEFKEEFSPSNIAVISNTIGSSDDINFSQALLVENTLGIEVLKHKYKKPKVKQEILSFLIKNSSGDKSNLSIDDEKRLFSELCIIGDRLFVDVLMGNELGSFTILTDPIDTKCENIAIRLTRKIEQFYL